MWTLNPGFPVWFWWVRAGVHHKQSQVQLEVFSVGWLLRSDISQKNGRLAPREPTYSWSATDVHPAKQVRAGVPGLLWGHCASKDRPPSLRAGEGQSRNSSQICWPQGLSQFHPFLVGWGRDSWQKHLLHSDLRVSFFMISRPPEIIHVCSTWHWQIEDCSCQSFFYRE